MRFLVSVKRVRFLPFLFLLLGSFASAGNANMCTEHYDAGLFAAPYVNVVETQTRLQIALQKIRVESENAFSVSMRSGETFLNSKRMIQNLDLVLADIGKLYSLARRDDAYAVEFADALNNTISVFISEHADRAMFSGQRSLIAAKILPLFRDLIEHFPRTATMLKIDILNKLHFKLQNPTDREIYRTFYFKILAEPDALLPQWLEQIEGRIHAQVPALLSTAEAKNVIDSLRKQVPAKN